MTTEKENYLSLLAGEIPQWVPNQTIGPMPGLKHPTPLWLFEPIFLSEFRINGGGKDIWGVEYVSSESAGGAVAPSTTDLLLDGGYYHNPAEEDGFALRISPEDVELLRECRPYWDDEGNYLSTMAEAWQPDGFTELKALECTDYYEGMPLMICATGHLCAGFKKIIDVGYGAIRKQAQDWIDSHKGNLMGEDLNKYIFYKAATIACDAAITFVGRYAEEARRKASECEDPTRKAELEMMADSLEWISTNPARTFWEACQATLLYQTLLYLDQGHSPSCSLGRFDQYTYPYLERDLAEGRITMDEAQEIVGQGNDYPAPCGVHPPHCSVWFGVVLTMAINNGVNPVNGLQGEIHTGYLYEMETFQEVLDAYEKLAHHYMRWEITMNNYTEYVTQMVSPHALLSISMDDCMERGLDCTAGGCRYNSYGGTAPGLATISDSLTAIKYMCFDKKICTTREMYDAVMANWEGYEDLRLRVLNEVPHYGNSDPYADELHTWVVNVYLDCCAEGYSPRACARSMLSSIV